MSYVIPGPCILTFNSVPLETTKAGVTLSTTNHDVPIIHDAGGSADTALIRGGKSLIISADIIDVTLNIAQQIIDGLFGYLSDDGSESNDAPSLGVAAPIGSLASEIAATLTIAERQKGRVTAYSWVTPGAVLMDPTSLVFNATQELIIPCQWLVVPTSDGVLFSTVPAYLQA